MTEQLPSVLTTGQAAKLCEVTPDTVLKWIRKGRLQGSRTAGGHFRINLRDLQPHIPSGRIKTSPEAMNGCSKSDTPCWEYLGNGGELRESCKQCVVYQVRASRCFLMAGMEPEIGHAKRFCQTSCQECVYYRRVQGLATNVLVITSDEEAIERLAAEENESVAVRCARDGYEASAVIEEYRPAFAVIEEELLAKRERGLLDHLAKDPRVPGLKVILLVPPGKTTRKRSKPKSNLIVGVLAEPIDLRQIADVINSFPVDSLLPEGNSL